MSQERQRIPVNPGVTLEAALSLPTEPAKAAALILHPHPLYGGSMDNNVVQALEQAALAAGWAALKFNFRGVWPSTGQHDHGQGEQQDVIAAAAWLRDRLGLPLGLLGYSFGTLVGSATAPRLGAIAAGAWIAPALVLGPLAPWPPHAGPLLLVAGDRDPYTRLEGLEAYAQGLGTRGRLVTLPEADHFLGGRESVLIQEVSAWLAQAPL
ncbi:MAG: alpha/beta hydrolase [Desulfarculus sp.]|nr:alpha/beta hydrolase [Desulfarculus sp.]